MQINITKIKNGYIVHGGRMHQPEYRAELQDALDVVLREDRNLKDDMRRVGRSPEDPTKLIAFIEQVQIVRSPSIVTEEDEMDFGLL